MTYNLHLKCILRHFPPLLVIYRSTFKKIWINTYIYKIRVPISSYVIRMSNCILVRAVSATLQVVKRPETKTTMLFNLLLWEYLLCNYGYETDYCIYFRFIMMTWIVLIRTVAVKMKLYRLILYRSFLFSLYYRFSWWCIKISGNGKRIYFTFSYVFIIILKQIWHK